MFLDFVFAVGPATAESVTDEQRFFALGVMLLYPIVFNNFLNKGERIPTALIILLTGIVTVPIFGQKPLQTSDDFIHIIHLISLNFILFSSGLDTKFASIRSILRYSLLISTLGVVVSSAIIGTLFYLTLSSDFLGFGYAGLEHIPFNLCILIGACLGSTDAGTSISILARLPVKLPEKVFNIIKFESSINDPSAVIAYGVVGSWILSEAFKTGATSSDLSIASNLTFRSLTDNFVGLFSTGILVGVVFGYLSIWMLKNLNIRKPQLLAAGLAIVSINYAISNYMGGSGLISAFVSGMVLINLHKSTDILIIKDMKESMMPFEELAEMFIYFSFAARIDPESLFRMLPLGLICAFIMMVIARPMSIYIFQPFSSLNWRESSLLGWCGLKGSVTLALSFEMVDLISKAQVLGANFSPEFAQNIQSIIFITAITNLFVQSISISSVANWATTKAELIEKV